MSPARSLLVACACAALLLAASSATLPVARQERAIGEKCASALIGRKTSDALKWSPVLVPPGVSKKTIQTPDSCARRHKGLVGEVVTVCSSDGSSTIEVDPHTFQIVVRNYDPDTPVTIHVEEYCA